MQNHTSVPIPKFAHPRGPLRCELRNQRDTSNFMIVVRHLDLKFLNELAAIMIGNFKSAALALLWQIEFTPQSRPDPSSAVRAALKRSHDEIDDSVAHGWQAWLRWWSVDSFFPASLG